MSLDDTQPSRQALAAKDRSSRLKVSGKLLRALNYMIEEGKPRKEAATLAGMTDHGLREALRRPHVRKWYFEQLDVLRTGERVRNFLALCEVRDQKENHTARVNAIRALEQMEDQQVTARSLPPAPGVVIVIEQRSVMTQERQDDAKPLIEGDIVRDGE